MYSNIKSVQYLVAMLKEQKITNIVTSPGNSHNAIIRSIEEDGSFKTFSITDERSAAFFAIGLIQELNEPVAIISTAGTAVSNYLSGVSEAYKRDLPLIVITADKNPYYYGQMENQMVRQTDIFASVTKKEVTLPMIKDGKDEWYCNRLLNEAFLEMNHHGIGPIHINVPIEEGMRAINEWFTTPNLPKIRVVKRYNTKSDANEIGKLFNDLGTKKILFLCGQNTNNTSEINKLLTKIYEKYNCSFATDNISNIDSKGAFDASKLHLVMDDFKNFAPDIVITLFDGFISDIQYSLKGNNKTEHWLVNNDGTLKDPFKKLTKVFEGDVINFLKCMANNGNSDIKNTYYTQIETCIKKFRCNDFEYSNLYAMQKLFPKLPKNSTLNLANSTTIRISQYFDIDKSIKVYCNRGVNGIDGCMSTFIGQASVSKNLNFLIIGDLTFFYDMNALWNRYCKNNIRIMLNNNSGASLFHFGQGLKSYPKLNENVAAEHFTTAKGWSEDQGFMYLSAKNKEEFDKNLPLFLNEKSDKPILFEVFTDKAKDAEVQHGLHNYNLNLKTKTIKEVKKVAKKILKK